jgi:PAS domain-containing protein
MRALNSGEIAAVAMDVTDLNPTDTELKERAQMEIDAMDSLSVAVAIFTHDRKLVHCNRAYAQLWQLSGTWLDTHPTEDEILERLREASRLPERRDFQTWKRDHLNLFEMTEGQSEDLWHLASGRSLRVEARRLAQGGLVFIYEDITERLRLESTYNTVVKVQKAMLDALSEAVAVFGPDNRLKTYNVAFARQWLLADDDLEGEPHMNRIADLSTARIGCDQFWEMVRSGAAASEPERGNEWGFVTRADGKELWLALARLPDGSTLLTVREVPGRNGAKSRLAQAAA